MLIYLFSAVIKSLILGIEIINVKKIEIKIS